MLLNEESHVSLCRNKLLHFLLSEKELCATLDRATHDKLLALVSEERPKQSNVTVRTSQTSQHDLLLFLSAVIFWELGRPVHRWINAPPTERGRTKARKGH